MGGGGKGGSQTIGYKYYLGLHMLLCHGPVDKVGPIYAGERTAYSGSVYYDGTVGDPRPIFSPPSGWDLRMTLTSDDIDGTLSPWTDAQNVTNVTFGSGGATFANGYMDIGDFSLGAIGTGGWGNQTGSFSVAFVFTPADAGDDLQVLLGKHTDDSPGDGGKDIFVLWYQRSKGRIGYTIGRAEVSGETETDIYWLSEEDVFSTGEEHEVMLLWRQTRWDQGRGEISYSTSVSLYRNNSFIGNSSYGEHGGWTGRSWVLGADWDFNEASRDNEYNGTMRDFYIWDDRLLTTSELWPVSSTPGASEQRIYIEAPELFGGKKREGGIQGKVDICFGASNQEQNDYLLDQPGMTTTTLPAYRGVVSVIARQCYVCAMSPYPKPWWFRIEDIPGKDWYPSKASINPGSTGTSANAAHMLRQCILDDEWGMGYPHTSVDDSSFEACADTLYDEGFGLSMLLNNQGSIEDLMQEILKHVNGVLYTDRETGLFTMKLIRDDYSIPSLPIFDDNNIVALDSFQRPTFAEMVNEVTIIYRKRGDFQDSSVTFQDLASVQAQGGVVAQTMNFPGVDDSTIASKVGMRELKQQSTPLAQVQLTVNRDGWSVNPGDPIVFEWPEYGITQMVLRVLKANYGEVLQGKIKFDCVEDAFGLPATTYLEPQDSMWEDPVSDPTAVPDSWLQEATYYELATGVPLGSTWVEDLDPAAAFLIYMAKPTAVASSSFELWTYPSSLPYTFKATGSYTIIGELSLSVGYTDTVFKLANLGGGADSIEANSYAFIGNEIVRIDDVDLDTEEVTVGRGCIDTIPEQHLAGTEMWFGKTSWGLDFTEYAQGNTVHAKALPMTGYGTLDISLATDETLTMVGRQYKPYPVARVAFQSSTNYYPLFVYGANATLVYFANRNRLQQTVIDQIEDWFDSNITPEANVTYTFRWFGELDVGKAATGGSRVDTGVTGTSHSWARADELADSNVGAFSPIDGHDLNMPLNSDDIGGTLSPWTDAQNVTNVTFTDRATFAAGYMDIGDFALTTAAFTISMIFVPQNTGDDYQLLIGKHTDDGTGGTNIFSVFWRRSTKQLYIGYGSTVVSVGTTGDVRIGRKNELMVVRNGSYTRLSLNGKYLGQRSHSISSWTGRPWVLGADWQPSDPTRQFRYNGTMHDLRIWDNTILVESDLWPNDRVNRYFRLVIETIRDGTNSLQNYDFTVDDRGGWGLSWDNNFNT